MDDDVTTTKSNQRQSGNRTVLQVAAILIAAGVLLKLYRAQSQRGDDRAFGRLRREVDKLDVPAPDKELLRRVLEFCRRLAREARTASPA